MAKVEGEKHQGMYQPPMGKPVWHTAHDAARAMAVSVSAVRRAARRAGVVRIAGRTVAGMVRLNVVDSSVVGYMPYAG